MTALHQKIRRGLNRVNDEAIPSRHVVSEVRANLFEWLPSYDEPLGKWFGYRGSAHSGPVKKVKHLVFMQPIWNANTEVKTRWKHGNK